MIIPRTRIAVMRTLALTEEAITTTATTTRLTGTTTMRPTATTTLVSACYYTSSKIYESIVPAKEPLILTNPISLILKHTKF